MIDVRCINLYIRDPAGLLHVMISILDSIVANPHIQIRVSQYGQWIKNFLCYCNGTVVYHVYERERAG